MTKNLKGTDKVLNLKEIEVVEIDTLNSSFCSGRVNTREKSPAFKLEYHLLISPGSHETPNKPRLLSRGKNPKGFVIFKIDCETEKGYCEDPDFTGTMKVLDVKKDKKESNIYTLKIKFVKDENE